MVMGAYVCGVRHHSTSSTSGGGDGDGSALRRLLQDPNDPYLHDIQELSLPKIVQTIMAGPTAAAVAARQRRPRVLGDVAPSVFPAPPPTATASPAEGVLESLRVHGLERQHQAMTEAAAAEEAAERQRRKAREAKGGRAEEDEAALAEAMVQHCWEGLCAVNAVLRVQMEDISSSPPSPVKASSEDLDAAFEAYTFIYSHYKGGEQTTSPSLNSIGIAWTIPSARWEEDYVPEVEELRQLFHLAGDERVAKIKG